MEEIKFLELSKTAHLQIVSYKNNDVCVMHHESMWTSTMKIEEIDAWNLSTAQTRAFKHLHVHVQIIKPRV